MLPGAVEQLGLSPVQGDPHQVKLQSLVVAPPPTPPPPAHPHSSPDVAPEANDDEDNTCTAVYERGTRKGVRCAAHAKPGTAFCGKHKNWVVGGLGVVRDRQRKRKEVDSDKDNNLKMEPNSESHGRLQDREHDLETGGWHASVPEKWKEVLTDISKIPEKAYGEAFEVTRMEPPKRTSRETSRIRKLHDFRSSDRFIARCLQCSLTQATLDRLPKVDSAGYDAVVTGSVLDLAFSFFNIMFPVEAVDLMVKYINDNHDDDDNDDNTDNDSCTNEEDPTGRDGEQQTREPRHVSKSKTLGSGRVPHGGFRREHVYGSLGILLEMLITRLPRMCMHWGTGGKHNFPHVRRTMPRYFFFLLMARLFHLAPGESSEKGNTSYDSAAHIRALGNKVQLAATNSYLVMKKWAVLLLSEVQSHLKETRLGDGEADADGAVEGSDRTDAGPRGTNLKPCQVTEMERALVKLLRVEKYKWNIHISDSLEDKCRVGDDTHHLDRNRKQKNSQKQKSPPLDPARPEVRSTWLSGYLKSTRVCSVKDCSRRTLGICVCHECTGDEIIMCKTCAFDGTLHKLARQFFFSKRKDGRPRSRKKVRRHEPDEGSNGDEVTEAP